MKWIFWGTPLLLFFLVSRFARDEAAKPASREVRAIVSPQTAVVSMPGLWRVSFIIDADSMAVGGGVKVGFIKGFSALENTDQDSVGRVGRVEANCSNVRSTVRITQIRNDDPQVPWDWDRNFWVVTARIQQRAVLKGDTIHLVFGGTQPGEKYYAPKTAFVDSICVAYDLTGRGVYRELTPKPVLEILSGPPHQLSAILPSTARVGEAVTLQLIVLDAHENLATSFTGTLTLTATDVLATFPKTVALNAKDGGRKTLTVVFNTPGIHSMMVAASPNQPDSLWRVRTNPIEVLREPVAYRVFWGDLHSHSSYSHDGFGTGSFLRARDVAGLDFYALTDHTSNDWKRYGNEWKTRGGITPEEWTAIKRDVVAYHQPGKFVTFPGYEFSARLPSGHHNVIFNAPDELMAYVPLLREDVYLQVQEIWKLKNSFPPNIDMITVPHHTGILGEGNSGPLVNFGEGFGHRELRPLIEIYSLHGFSEYYLPEHPLSYQNLYTKGVRLSSSGPHYAQDAWAAGEYLGVIASGDDHTARPGRPYYGLAAVYATELTRDAIFDALKKRRTYGTTGQRMLVQFDINGFPMGSEILVQPGNYPEISLAVHGTDELDFVEVVRWNKASGRRQNGHPQFESIYRQVGQGRDWRYRFIDSTYTGNSLYYLRAKQKRDIFDPTRSVYRQVWAWSSPIWVNEPQTLDTVDRAQRPGDLLLRSNYPNPFHRRTSMAYYLPRDSQVEAALYNLSGQLVRPLASGFQPAGWHALQISQQGLTPGVYFVRLTAAGQVITRKILLMR
ncbi:MAG: DUF3604 domain-containing protein [candidate division KSB1 bacterium]|nr:DUF3604 domain-containing protein [candidate division KSB1 bacterium]